MFTIPPVNDMGDIHYIGFWKRCLALILDCLLFFIAFFIPFFLLQKYLLGYNMVLFMLFQILSQIGILLIIFFCMVKYGGSVGKIILGYKVVDQCGRYLSIKSVFLRSLPLILSMVCDIVMKFYTWHKMPEMASFTSLNQITMSIVEYGRELRPLIDLTYLIYVIDCLWIIFNFKKRSLHDYLAGSFVVTKKSAVILDNLSRQTENESPRGMRIADLSQSS